ncbi:hypothetical protein JX266_011083 [Neoarthrinium moseri]|nr:hypothetical protein JX266_011083 [Neoarthrinium moseri]
MSASTPYKRESPFLHRMWKSATESAHSVAKSVHSVVEGLSATNGDRPVSADHTHRATKRRRITEDSLDPGAVAAVGPLFRDPSEGFDRALRVEVLRIGREEHLSRDANGLLNGNGSPVKKDNLDVVVRARCRLTIFRFRPKVEMKVLYCDSQTCDLKVFRDPDGVCRTARVYLQQPFHIAADKICIEHDDGQGFRLADDYLIQTELESAGDPRWPPLDLLQGEDYNRPSSSSPRQWVLSSRFVYKYVKPRMSTSVRLRKTTGDDVPTDLMMDTDLRWSSITTAISAGQLSAESTPSELKVPRVNGVLEPLTNGHVNGRTETLVNGHGNHDDPSVMDDDEDPNGEAVTPSRSLRMRDKPQSYNLKLLSDKARGKELKERKKRKDAGKAAELGQVTWILPVSGRSTTDNWSCLRCFAAHSSFDQLKAHISDHDEFKFTIDFTPRGGWRIAISRHGQETPRVDRTQDFLEPPSPDDHEEDSPAEVTPEKPAPRQRPKLATKRTLSAKPKENKQIIPNNKQPMFDRISKALLEPNSRVDEPQVDNSWLLQKHRDIIKDYTDVHPDEKEYVSEWDAFSLTHKATLAPQLQGIYLDFIEEKALWLASSQNRMNEVMKHLAYLKARDTLKESTITKALAILRNARIQARHEPEAIAALSKPDTRTSRSGCTVCGMRCLSISQGLYPGGREDAGREPALALQRLLPTSGGNVGQALLNGRQHGMPNQAKRMTILRLRPNEDDEDEWESPWPGTLGDREVRKGASLKDGEARRLAPRFLAPSKIYILKTHANNCT